MLRIRQEQKLPDDVFYHYDTPLTVEHEKEALLEAGFSQVNEIERWEVTHTLKAVRCLCTLKPALKFLWFKQNRGSFFV